MKYLLLICMTLISFTQLSSNEKKEYETAVFAGGCFWGVEAVFEELNGIIEVISGYSGGDKNTAIYKLVSSGQTDHAEAVKIVYDNSIITYKELLDVFFIVAHDPTQLNYQGPDKGREYRSAIFYLNSNQKNQATNYKRSVEGAVTEINRLEAFYPAERYHQNFMKKNPNHPYIVYWDYPKIKHLKKAFPTLIKK